MNERAVGAGQLALQVVSHGHGALVAQLLDDLGPLAGETHVLENQPGALLPVPADRVASCSVNAEARGFAANHNALARRHRAPFVAILNPDVRVADASVFTALLACFDDPAVGVVAPVVHAPDGRIEDNARDVVTPLALWRRHVGGRRGGCQIDGDRGVEVDWVAGMFLIVRRTVFDAVGGFDERFRLYGEDVAFSLAVWCKGYKVVLAPVDGVIHDARRASHRQPKFLYWHVTSLLKLWCSRGFWRFLLRHGRRPDRNSGS